MAPPSGLHQSAIPSDSETPFPPLVRSSTVPASIRSHRADPSHLSPEDAYAPFSPTRRFGSFDSGGGNGSGTESRSGRIRHKDTSRSRSRRRKRFQKLLWVKQSCAHCLIPHCARNIHTDPIARNRPGQLHRPSHLPRESPAQPPRPALRLLAFSGRLDRHRAARLLRHHLRRVLRGHISRARQPCIGGWVEQLCDLCGLAAVGLVGHERVACRLGRRGCQSAHDTGWESVQGIPPASAAGFVGIGSADAQRQYREHLEHIQLSICSELDLQSPPSRPLVHPPATTAVPAARRGQQR